MYICMLTAGDYLDYQFSHAAISLLHAVESSPAMTKKNSLKQEQL